MIAVILKCGCNQKRMDYIGSKDLYICTECGNVVYGEFVEQTVKPTMERWKCNRFYFPKTKNSVFFERLDKPSYKIGEVLNE